MIVSIDIGTSYSSICIVEQDGSARPVDISTGASMYGSKFSLPSAVYVEDDGSILVGQAAMNSRKRKPQNFRMEFKRDLGQDVPVLLGNRSFQPEELYTEMFRHMKERAERSAGEKIERAYLTYPASFGKARKEKVISAARAAGLFDVKLVDEPTAAAMSYCRAGLIQDGQTLLIYDFGGGTFDVSLLRYENGNYRLLTEPDGLEHCGGIDIDRMIYQDMLAQIDPELLKMVNANRLNRMRLESQLAEMAVKAKHHLSSAGSFEEDIQIGFDMIPYRLSREQLNARAAGMVGKTITVCRSILQAGGITVGDLSAVLLVGGTSRVPLVQDMVRQFAGEVPVLASIDLELAVAQGAGGFFVSQRMPDPAEMKRQDLEQKAVQEEEPPQRQSKKEAGISVEQCRRYPSSRLSVIDLADGTCAVAGVKSDGAVLVEKQISDMEFLQDEKKIRDIVFLRGGVALLREDGTVRGRLMNSADAAQVEKQVAKWKNVIAVEAGYGEIIGLRKDGTVVAAYSRSRPEYRGVSSWKDLVSITISRSSSSHLVGICRDGTVLAAGHEVLYQSETYQYPIRKACDVFGWRDIRAVACGQYYTMGLKKDGTVVVTGDNDVARAKGGISLWRDIVSVAGGDRHAVGLKKDGTVEAVGWNGLGQGEVSDWTDIISVACGPNHTAGLKRDGTVVAVGQNECGQCNVSDWKNVITIIARENCTVGICSNGSVVRTDYDRMKKGRVAVLPAKTLPWRLFSPEDSEPADAGQASPAAEGKDETGDVRRKSKQEDAEGSALERYRNHAETLVSMNHLAVKSDGSLKIDEDYFSKMDEEYDEDLLISQDKMERWKSAENITAVAAGFGVYAILRTDGRVEAYGSSRPDMGNQADLWRNVTRITSIGDQLIGIHEDGTLSVTIEPEDYDTVVTKYVRHWKNIASVWAADDEYRFDKILVAGLCRDGTVVAADGNGELDLSGWNQMTQVRVVHDRNWTKYAVAGLRKDGRVMFSGDGYTVNDWEDIVQIDGGYDHLVGLKRDGTVVSAGDNGKGQRNVQHWNNMVSIFCIGNCTVGLRRNGTVAVMGEENRERGWGNIPAWKDIIAILSDGYDVCGIRQDGALIYTNYEMKKIKRVVKRHLFQADETETRYEPVPLPEKILPWKLF